MKDATTILYVALTIGGIIGGILTAWNKFRFIKKSDFADHIKTCPETIGEKIDNVKETVEDLKSTVEENAKEGKIRREADQEFLHEHLINIATFVGRVEQYMANKKL